MSDQLSMFRARRHGETVLALELQAPLARTCDPATSHLAAAEISESGDRAADAVLVQSVVRREPGLTYREIAARCPAIAEAVTVMKRLNDLRHEGLVATGERRTCRVSGNPCTTWFPAED